MYEVKFDQEQNVHLLFFANFPISVFLRCDFCAITQKQIYQSTHLTTSVLSHQHIHKEEKSCVLIRALFGDVTELFRARI